MQDPRRTTHSRRRSRGRKPDGAPNPIDLHIGSRIRKQRLLRGWSQEHLGKMLGITFQQVQKYEKADNRISGSRLYDFACLLGVDANFFYQDMPEEIRRQGPRYFSCSGDCADAEFAGRQDDPMLTDAAFTLVQSFLQIPQHRVADLIFELVKALGGADTLHFRKQNGFLQPQETDNAEDC